MRSSPEATARTVGPAPQGTPPPALSCACTGAQNPLRSRDAPTPDDLAATSRSFASAGAGLVHAAAAGSHNGEAEVAWLFAVTAVAQLGWAAFVAVRPWPWLLAAGIALNGACVVAWVLSRTVGLVGPLAGVEAVGTPDAIGAVLGDRRVRGRGGRAARRSTSDRPTRRSRRRSVVGPSMLSLDGDEHRRHRDPFAAAFRRPQVMERFGDRVRERGA